MKQPPEVVNLKTDKYDVYIGRPSSWGNPHIIFRNGSRDEVCDKHEAWLRQWIDHKKEIIIKGMSNKWMIEHLGELEGEIIGCYCTPKRCHGDTLVKIFIEMYCK